LSSVTDHRKGLQAVVSQEASRAERDYKAQHPEAQALRVRKLVAAYAPRAKEIREIPVRAVGLFLRDPSSLAKSNAEIAAELGTDVGRRVPPNILSEQLTAKHIAQIGELLALRKVTVDLATCDTPSKIKKALKGRRKAAMATVRCTVAVSFSEDAVTVGDRSYPVTRSSGVPRIALDQRTKLNVDALRRLLCDLA
jgi:hypothetical protein